MSAGGHLCLLLKKSSDRRNRERLEKAFQEADKNKDGFVSPAEYHQILKDHGVKCTLEEVTQIVQLADKNRDGKLSKAEFMGEESTRKSSSAELAFEVMDQNNDGVITRKEMHQGIGSRRLSKEQVDVAFDAIDKDRDGKVTKGEFVQFMKDKKKSKK